MMSARDSIECREPLYRGVVTAFDKQAFKPKQQRAAETAPPKIRCPQCRWQPEKSSRWICLPMGAPEYFAGGCGHSWHTFDTRGLCPGCKHQWRYTSCLRCLGTSPHDDWYEQSNASPPKHN